MARPPISLADITDVGQLARKDRVGTEDLLPESVTFHKIQNIQSRRLIGRGDHSGKGKAEDIQLGSNLSMDGNVLNADGGGGGGPHTHPIADITSLQAELDGKAAQAHSHAISDVTNLQTTLDGKAASSHTHSISQVTNLQSSLDGKATTSHTHPQSDVTNLTTDLAGKAPVSHTHTESGLSLSDNTTNNASTSAHGFCPKLNNNPAQYLNGQGQFTTPAGGGSDPAGWTTIVKSANQDVINAQNADATELQFPVVAGNLYAVELYLFYSGSDATGDFEYRFAVSAGTMDGVGHDFGDNAADAVTNLRLTAVNLANTANVPHGCAANLAIPRPATAQFNFRHNTTNGTFKVQFGNNAAAAGRTSRILKGSILRYKQLT